MPEPTREEMTEFLFRLNEILWQHWDPLGVSQPPSDLQKIKICYTDFIVKSV